MPEAFDPVKDGRLDDGGGNKAETSAVESLAGELTVLTTQ